MNGLDVLRWLGNAFESKVSKRTEDDDDGELDLDYERAADLAANAAGAGVTKPLLVDEDHLFTRNPPLTYLEAEEQPEYALAGGRVWFGEDPSMQGDEVPTRRTLVLVTDSRILIVVGNRIRDTAWGVPYEDVEHVTIRYSDVEAYFLLDVTDEENAETTLVELLADSDREYFSTVVSYCNARAGGE